MTRKFWLGIIFSTAILLSCNLFSGTSGAEKELELFRPSSDIALESGSHQFKEFIVDGSVTVTLKGDTSITVDGPIQIDGLLRGDCTKLELRGSDDLSITGEIQNTCSKTGAKAGPGVRLIADGLITMGSSGNKTPVIVSSGDIYIGDSGGEDLNLSAFDGEEGSGLFGPIAVSHLAISAPQQGGGNGVTIDQPLVPGPGGSISIPYSRQGAAIIVNTSLTAQDGEPGTDLQDSPVCDASGNRGKPGGSIRLAAPNGKLIIQGGITLTAGDGGKGGSCRSEGGLADLTATAGKGGVGGSVLVGGRGLEIGAGVTFVRGSGGPGGDATAIADHATASCTNGFNATATAGEGGNRGGVGYVIVDAPDFTGTNPNVDGGNGGKGGKAEATAGNGALCDQCPGGGGGTGGAAAATGGQGGDGGTRAVDWNITGGHKAGDGGDAKALGGEGLEGATCCTPPQQGGEGGSGGGATANGGAPGDRGKEAGSNGRSTGSFANDGGPGGSGNPPGDGGEGGVGAGVPDHVPDGEAGAPALACAPPVISLIDPFDDPADCVSLGQDPSLTILPISDMGEVSVELVGSEYIFRINFPQTVDLNVDVPASGLPFWGGGMEFNDPQMPLLDDPNWGPNAIGHQSFNFLFDPQTGEFIGELFEVEGGNWQATDQSYPVQVFENVLTMSVPVEDVVFDGKLVYTTAVYDGEKWTCDLVGLGEDGLPGIDLDPLTGLQPPIGPGDILTGTVSISDTIIQTNTLKVYEVMVGTGFDGANHGPNIPMQSSKFVTVTTELETFSVASAFPWISVSGELTDGQNQKGFGSGVVANFSNIQVEYHGEKIPPMAGTLWEPGGGLPSGLPISYTISTVGLVYSVTITDTSVTNPLATPSPPPDPTFQAQQFYGNVNTAFIDQDADWLFNNLHPEVFGVYGQNTCLTYLEGVILTPISIEVKSASGPEPWIWIQDGNSTAFDGAYSVIVNLTAQGETSEREVHLVPGSGGVLNWFTDCGDPQ